MPPMATTAGRRLQRGAERELRDGRRKMQRNLRSQEWRNATAVIAAVIAGYFVTSVGLTFFQKSLISHLRYPMTIVTCHLFLKFIFAWVCRSAWTSCTGKERVVLSWSDYLSRVTAVAVFSALDISLSQWSFEYITVALYTMTKTTSVLFILAFALMFRLERKHWSLIAVVIMISVGLFLFVFRSTQFNPLGFCMALTASFLSGARWTLAQLIMQRGRLGLEHPLDFIYHLQPLMVLTVLPLAAIFEGVAFASSEHAFRYHELEFLLHTVGMILLGGCLAFVMEMFEFFIITKASSLTLSIVGITKEIVTICIDVLWNGSELSSVNIVGAVVCLTGIAVHVYRKATDPEAFNKAASRNDRRSHRPDGDAHSEFSLPLLSDDSDDSTDEDELFHPGGRPRLPRSASAPGVPGLRGGGGFRDFDESFYLRDQREWTSVRDSHLQSGADLAEQPAEQQVLPEAPRVLKQQGDGHDSSSLQQTEKVLKQPQPLAEIDLLSD